MNYPIYNSTLRPSNRFVTKGINAKYALLEDYYIQGGYRVCADIGERNLITYDRRKVGMMVHTLDDEKYWVLINEPVQDPPDLDSYASDDATPTTNDDWEEFESGSNWRYINDDYTTATNLEGFPEGEYNFPDPGWTNYQLWTQLLYPYLGKWWVEPENRNVECSSGTTTFTIVFANNWTGETSWYIELTEETGEWCRITDPESLTGESGYTFTVEYGDNCALGKTTRIADIYVYLSGATDYRLVHITQVAKIWPEPTWRFVPSKQTAQATTDLTKKYNIIFEGGWLAPQTWTITSNFGATNTEPPWFTVSPLSGSGTTEITVVCEVNTGYTASYRYDYITATVTDSKSVEIHQEYIRPDLPSFIIVPTNVTKGPDSGTISGAYEIQFLGDWLTVDKEWTLFEGETWLDITPTSGTGDTP